MTMKRFTIAIVTAAALLSVTGCSQDASEESGHVHHDFPDHRPANLKSAVAAIKLRSWELANRGGRIGSREFYQLVDIINWVPEMAADSDLEKADWESAKAAAVSMRSKVLSKQLEIATLESVVKDELEILEALVPKAGKPEPDLHHQHSHHHHGADGHHHGEDHKHVDPATKDKRPARSHTD